MVLKWFCFLVELSRTFWNILTGRGPWLHHLLFVEDLHGIVVAGLFVLDKHHPPEGARAEGLDALKLIQLRCILGAAGGCRLVRGTHPGQGGGRRAEGEFLQAADRAQIRPWPGAQELVAAVWGG